MKFIIICGPTASGKSSLAMGLAQNRKIRIINADAIQVYKDIPIITAQPTPVEQKKVEHSLYGFKLGSESFSVNDWLEAVLDEISRAGQEGCLPVLVGGTGMYIKMLTHGFKDLPHLHELQKQEIEQEIVQIGLAQLYHNLCSLDVAYKERLNSGDKHRIIRAYGLLKYHNLNAKNIADTPNKAFFSKRDYKVFYLCPERENLYFRSDQRVKEMLAGGAIAEVKKAQEKYQDKVLLGKAIGFKEILDYLENKSDYAYMTNIFQQNTRRFIKRQYTWFNNQLEEHIALTEPNVNEMLKNL
jgi:tRNA dimethylallyltransferase